MKKSLLVKTAIGIIENEFSTIYGIEDLADRMEITAPHLIREFKKSVGMTPGKYLKKCRIEYAKKLLAESDHPVNLIAVMCGFSEAGYFSRVFRTEAGITPLIYRKLNYSAANTKDHKVSEAEKAMYL